MLVYTGQYNRVTKMHTWGTFPTYFNPVFSNIGYCLISTVMNTAKAWVIVQYEPLEIPWNGRKKDTPFSLFFVSLHSSTNSALPHRLQTSSEQCQYTVFVQSAHVCPFSLWEIVMFPYSGSKCNRRIFQLCLSLVFAIRMAATQHELTRLRGLACQSWYLWQVLFASQSILNQRSRTDKHTCHFSPNDQKIILM